MIVVPLTEDSLRVAFGRIQNFKSVHKGETNLNEPFAILREGLGVDEEMIALLVQLANELFTEDVDEEFMGGVLFGLMVGLIAADHASET